MIPIKISKRATLITLALLASVSAAVAAPLTPGEAIARLQTESARRGAPALNPNASMRLVHQISGAQDAAMYIFADTRGKTVITPADDAFAPVLAYLDTPVADWSQVPSGFKYWMEEYARQIDWQRTHHPDYVYEENTPSSTRPLTIAPLVKAKWGQGDPFNRLCPMTGSKRAWAGCVATAMAQVMHYHKYPAKGTGYFEYTREGSSGAFDYDANPFDWDNMLDSYVDVAFTEAQANAAATLTTACAVGMQMAYTPFGSGAQIFRAPLFLFTHMGYDKGVKWTGRKYYSTNEWAQMIYDDLAEGLPVLYGGLSAGGGHEFVCDGYDPGDYYHINWGWEGMCDGYYRLHALTPEKQGIGGSSTNDGYNIVQDAVLGMRPAREGSQRYIPVVGSGNLKPMYHPDYNEWGLTCDDGGFYFMCPDDIEMQMGVRIALPDGSSLYGSSDVFTFPGTGPTASPYSIAFFGADFAQLPPPGRYRIHPCVRATGGEWQDIRTEYGCTQYAEFEVAEDGTYTYHEAKNWQSTALKITDFAEVNKAEGDRPASYRVDYDNNADSPFVSKLRIIVRDPATGAFLSRCDFEANADGMLSGSSVFEFDSNLPAGDYEAVFAYPATGNLVEGGAFPIHIDTYNHWDLTATTTMPNAMAVGERANLKLNFTNNGSVIYQGDVVAEVVPRDGGAPVFTTSFTLEVQPGKSTARRVYVTLNTPDGYYTLRVLNKCGQLICPEIEIKVGDPAGVDTLQADPTQPFDLYTLDGILLLRDATQADLHTLPAGLYLQRQGQRHTLIRK